MTEPKAPTEFVREAYRLDDQDRMSEFYQKWASDYDHQMTDELEYLSPAILTNLFFNYVKTDARVIDIGCGTGLTSQPLFEKGFRNIDGIDLSPEMIDVARQRNIYQELLVGDLNQPLQRESGIYDAAISTGTFTHGHVGPDPLDEIFRILKPGGIFACTVHEALWHERKFDAKFESLISDGKISCLLKQHDAYFEGSPPEGWFCIYQKSTG